MLNAKENNQGKTFIIYPPQLGQIFPRDLVFCELFFNELLKVSKKEIYFSVNSDLNYVESNDENIKKLLTLILRAGKIDLFYTLFKKFLHTNTQRPPAGSWRSLSSLMLFVIFFYRLICAWNSICQNLR